MLSRYRSNAEILTALIVSAVPLWFVSPPAIASLVMFAIIVPAQRRRTYAFQWVPFAVAVAVFNALRSTIYDSLQSHHRHIFGAYAVVAERAVLAGHLAPTLLRSVTYPALDWIALGIHLTHFLFFLVFVVVAWRIDDRLGAWTQRALVVVFAVGLLMYYLVPTAPPWYAASAGWIPDAVPHASQHLYARLFTSGTLEMVDTNPVAAMPSLHAAFPAVCAAIGWTVFRRSIGVMLWAYTAAQCLGVMYLGEHYLVDVLAGLLLAAVAVAVTSPSGAGAPAAVGST